MKIRLVPLWIFVVIGMFLVAYATTAHADLTWDTPIGQIGLPLYATETLVGYDAVLRQAIAGVSIPVYTDPKKFLALQVGAVAPWQTNGPAIEPYVAAGHDILREIPVLQDYQSAHLNVFGRWASSQGKAGVGVSFSYSFFGPRTD